MRKSQSPAPSHLSSSYFEERVRHQLAHNTQANGHICTHIIRTRLSVNPVYRTMADVCRGAVTWIRGPLRRAYITRWRSHLCFFADTQQWPPGTMAELMPGDKNQTPGFFFFFWEFKPGQDRAPGGCLGNAPFRAVCVIRMRLRNDAVRLQTSREIRKSRRGSNVAMWTRNCARNGLLCVASRLSNVISLRCDRFPCEGFEMCAIL